MLIGMSRGIQHKPPISPGHQTRVQPYGTRCTCYEVRNRELDSDVNWSPTFDHLPLNTSELNLISYGVQTKIVIKMFQGDWLSLSKSLAIHLTEKSLERNKLGISS